MIYDFPKYYDLIYGSDCQAELEFLEYCFATYVPFEVTQLFEPACGTGRLLYRLAKRGYQVAGLDLNPAAVEFCNRRLTRLGFSDRAQVADMASFQLQQKFHASFNTVNSFRHLMSQEGAENHLACVANHLVDGGIYVLGIHLQPNGPAVCDGESWSAQRGHLAINTRMWRIDLDLKNRVETFRIEYDIYTPTNIRKICDDVPFRTYTRAQILELIENSAFRLIATYDFAYDSNDPIELDDLTEDVVLILQKKETNPDDGVR